MQEQRDDDDEDVPLLEEEEEEEEGEGGSGWTLLSDSSAKCVTKAVLDVMVQDTDLTPLQAYHQYVQSIFSFSVSSRTVSLLDQHLLAKFFGLDDDLAPPRFFNALQGSDLTKMERVVQRRIVLLSPSSSSKAGGSSGKNMYKVHDRRIFETLNGGPAWPVIYLVVVKLGRSCWELYKLADGLLDCFERPFLTEHHFAASHVAFGGCLLESLRVLLGLPEAVSELHSCVKRGGDSKFCHNLGEIASFPSEAHLLLGSPPPFGLASHLRTEPLVRRRLMKLPQHQGFYVVAVLASSRTDLKEGMPVMCVTSDLLLYRLASPYADGLLQNLEKRRCYPAREKLPQPADVLTEVMQDTARRRKRAAAEAPPLPPHGRQHLGRGRCPCQFCLNASSHEKNMSKNGPQLPYSTQLGLQDLYTMVGRMDEKLQGKLLHAAKLSLASWDVETVPTPVDAVTGNETAFLPRYRRGAAAAAAAGAAPDEAVPPSASTSTSGSSSRLGLGDFPKMARLVTAVQEPCLVGFSDYRQYLDGEPVQIFATCEDRRDALEVDFLEAVRRARDESCVLRYGVLVEEFEFIQAYKDAHYAFYARRGIISPAYTQQPMFSAAAASAPTAESLSPRPPAAGDGDSSSEDDEAFMERIAEQVVRELAQKLDGEEGWSSCEAAARDDDGPEEAKRPRLSSFSPGGRHRTSSDSSDDDSGLTAAGEVSDEDGGEDDDLEEFVGEKRASWARVVARQVRDGDMAKKIAGVEKAWSASILGQIELRLHYLCCCYTVMAFNAAR